MAKFPKDCNSRVIGSVARQQVHAAFNAVNWEYHEITGTDHGIDCTIELIESEEWHNHKIEGQIKGTKSPNIISDGTFSFSMDVKTINYGLSSANAFVLFYVDVAKENVYYLPIQDYFIANPAMFDKLDNNKATLNVRISKDNLVTSDDFELQEIAKSVYIDGPGRKLHKHII